MKYSIVVFHVPLSCWWQSSAGQIKSEPAHLCGLPWDRKNVDQGMVVTVSTCMVYCADKIEFLQKYISGLLVNPAFGWRFWLSAGHTCSLFHSQNYLSYKINKQMKRGKICTKSREWQWGANRSLGLERCVKSLQYFKSLGSDERIGHLFTPRNCLTIV